MPDHRGVIANRGGVDGVGGDGDHDDDSGVVNVEGSDGQLLQLAQVVSTLSRFVPYRSCGSPDAVLMIGA